MKITHIFLDMDGVLVDFVGGALRTCFGNMEATICQTLELWPAGEYDITKVVGGTIDEFWEAINAEKGFWESLSPYPWAADLIDLVESAVKRKWSIATSPSRDPQCAAGKVKWLQDNCSKGQSFRNYFITPEKHLLAGGNRTRVLIDDRDVNVDRWRECGGSAILFPQPWNSNHGVAGLDDESDRLPGAHRMEYVASRIKAIQDGLKAFGDMLGISGGF